jgi:dTDP-D-glucose 4,6-dehydratase
MDTQTLFEVFKNFWCETLKQDPEFRFLHTSIDEVNGTLGTKGIH